MPDRAAATGIDCPRCGTPVPPDRAFCPRCGVRAREGGTDEQSRIYLAFLVLGGLGAFGIPALWRSKAYGPVGKWVLATLAVLQTLLCVVVVYGFVVYGIPWIIHRSLRAGGGF